MMMLSKLAAFVWLLLIGSNAMGYWAAASGYTAPYLSATVLVGAAFFLVTCRRQFVDLLFFKDGLIVAAGLFVPVFLMLVAERSFERAAYTLCVNATIVYMVAFVIALRPRFQKTVTAALFVIVLMSAVLNLYELLIENNIWSRSPGRSAGLYVNPNISGSAIVGYGLFYLSSRVTKTRIVDVVVGILVVVGVFATFSRSSYLAGILLLLATFATRGRRGNTVQVLIGVAVIAVVGMGLALYVVKTQDLSVDAAVRLESFVAWFGAGDYMANRGYAAVDALAEFDMELLVGAGVGTVSSMEQGPHNMFIAMLINYGLVGLIAYIAVIVRLAIMAIYSRASADAGLGLFVGWVLVYSFSSHFLLDYIATIPLFGFALARACQARRHRVAR